MRLRVITATRGRSPHLAETVRSVANSAPGANHVLVCPGAAHEALAREFPSCRVVADDTAGLYPALNAGRQAGEPDDCFTWINDDDVLVAPGFGAALARLEADGALGAVYGRVGLVDATGGRLGAIPVAHRPTDLLPLLASGLMPLAQPGTIFRWSAAAEVGAFDAGFQLAGDLDFFVRALRAGVTFAFHDGEVAAFRLHAGQLSKDEATAAREHARVVATLPATPAGLARWRFRWDNLPAYVERVRQHAIPLPPWLTPPPSPRPCW
jgi:hypothetical protein